MRVVAVGMFAIVKFLSHLYLDANFERKRIPQNAAVTKRQLKRNTSEAHRPDMTASAENVHILMEDMASSGPNGGRIQFDSSPEFVKKDLWPSFNNWEYTVIFKDNLSVQEEELCKEFLGLVAKTGLKGQLFKSPAKDKNQMILKLKATREWYDAKAEQLEYLYEMKPILCNAPDPSHESYKVFKAKVEREGSKQPSITKMFEPFDVEQRQNFMFEGYHNMYSSFRGSMIEYFLRERPVDGGCQLAYFSQKKIIANYFPNHEPDKVAWFQSNWILSMPWNNSPIDEIRNYFGEKIAFYFAWLSHFTAWLVAPGFVGVLLAFFLVSRKIEEVNRSIIGPIFGVLLMIYMTVYLEFWKRRSATLAFNWGVTDYDKREPDRPEYEANDEDFNYFTQKVFSYFPQKERIRRQLIGLPAVLLTIAVACTIIIIILMWKYVQGLLGPDQQNDPFGAWKIFVPSLCNSIAIIVFSKVHRALATYLNDWENYQTQSEYESQLIRKVFFFEFVNNYTGLFYTAFGLGNMYQLYFAILVQMLIMQVVGNLQAIIAPYVEKRLNMRKKEENNNLTWADVLVGNDPYDTFGDFNEIVIQFGYIMFFSSAFPAAALLGLLNNLVEIRLDAHSILNCEPRPSAERKGGIGVWFDIVELMSFIAIVVNALIFALTSDAIGAGIHNACQFEFRDIDVTVNPLMTMNVFSWFQQGCLNFCSGMYQSQRFDNPSIYLSPCGTVPLVDRRNTSKLLPSCKTIPHTSPVECTETNPCPGKEDTGVGSATNNCDRPFLCNPVPLRVPYGSARSKLGRNLNDDWSRAYCQESPSVNLGSGEWRFTTPTVMHAWNPFMNPFPSPPSFNSEPPAYVPVRTSEYGMISCSLICDSKTVCPYSRNSPTFNPRLKRERAFRPMDYISPADLEEIQKAKDVVCIKGADQQFRPPAGSKYCFLCPDENLVPTQLVVGVDNFNEIVFTTAFGPSVAVLWTVLIFEHIVFVIKFFVMAIIPDVTDEIKEQLLGHETYRRRLAMNVDDSDSGKVSFEQDPDIVMPAKISDLKEEPQNLTLDMLKAAFEQPHQDSYSHSASTHVKVDVSDKTPLA